MDSIDFIAQRASYFRKLNEIRQNGTLIFYHDETWFNSGEEKRAVWVDDRGQGRIRTTQGKGPRLAISALINENGFHHPSIDIFKCDQEHSMDSMHFIQWISRTCSKLRKEFGRSFDYVTFRNATFKGYALSITIIIDNASWHREVTDDKKPPQRSWRKQMIVNWLSDHNVIYAGDISKAELLQLAYSNLPKKKYKAEEEAKIYRINILRLPIRHCTLNPIELAWANMKTYIRDRNTKFTLAEVNKLAQEWIDNLDATEATSYMNHVKQCEATFKKADMFAERIEEELNDDDDEDQYSVYSADTDDDDGDDE
ncbi:unnamed protein product [Rotaria sp. Silwood2]|nr:unnamed protein product [Rotaria sp. Silwood2]CAF4740991.1 unnamed protein product [Rotaria sp. Silwood2]